MPLSPGDKLGPYEILAPLGAGGMGEVYRAKDTKLDREVAIKVLPAGMAQDRERLLRFEREAKVLASLNHPHIAQIYGREDDALVMELVAGQTLAVPQPLETALEYARQIAEALEAAHEKGIIHRDLKPANIMVTPAGVVKVLDFGLASVPSRTAGASDPENSPTLTMGATQAGVIMGTAGYMSPEQAVGKPVDHRSDIWSFGVVLYELLSGARLFHGETISHTLADVLRAPLDLAKLPANTPPPIAELVRRCLDRNVKMRLQAIGEARIVVQRCLDHPGEVTVPPVVRANSKLPWILAGAATLAAVTLAVLLWRSPRASATRPLVMLDLDIGTEVSDPALSSDGQRVAFVANRQLAYRDLNSTTIRYLPRTENASAPFFSPDGKSLGYFANSFVNRIALDGGVQTALCPVISPLGAEWSDDGVIYVNDQFGSSLTRVPAAGGKCDTRPISKEKQRGLSPPRMLPGKKHLLRTEGNDIYAVPIAGGERKLLVKDAGAPQFLPDPNPATHTATGTLIYHQRGILYGVQLDLSRLETSGTPVALVDGIKADGAGLVSMDAAGPFGTLVYRQHAVVDHVVSWLEPDGSVKPLMEQAGQYRHVRFSPDGVRLAISSRTNAIEQAQMYIYDWNRRELQGLLEQRGGGTRDFPVWSPDGETLVMRADGAIISFNLATKTKSEIQQATILPWSFAPDGRTLLGTDSTDGGERLRRRLRLFPVEKTPGGLRYGPPREWVPLPGDNSMPAVSPDGKWVAFDHRVEKGEREVFVVSYPPSDGSATQKWQVSFGGGTKSRWTKNELFFCSPDSRVMVAPYAVKDGVFVPGSPRRWSERRLGECEFDVTPDGQRVAAVVDRQEQKPETHLHFLLNVVDEFARRAAGTR